MSHPSASHRNTNDPQPEFCDLCNLKVGGAHLKRSNVEGLRGYMICDVTPDCRRMRSARSYKDRRRANFYPISIGTGQHPVFPPGGPDFESPD